MTFLAKLIFVSSSWAPVYLLIAALLWSVNPLASKSLIAISAGCACLVWFIKHIVETRFASDTVEVCSATKRQDDIFMYVLTYIPPFFAADLSSTPRIAALALLYVFVFVTYIRLSQYHLNPLFVFFGYQVIDIETRGGLRLHVVTRQKQAVESGQMIRVAIFSDLALLR